jgi:hypothetical protein
MITKTQTPQETINSTVDAQFEIARRSLAYIDRFEKNENSAELDARLAEASRAAGGK